MFRSTIFVAVYLLLASISSSNATAQSEPAIGVTRKGNEIPVHLPKPAQRNGTFAGQFSLVIIGGNDGQGSLLDNPEELWRALDKRLGEKPLGNNNPRVSPAIIPNVYPDGPPPGITAADTVRGFPPRDGYYDHKTQPESRYLWRWVSCFGPDLIIDIRTGKAGFYFAGQMNEDEHNREEIRKQLRIAELDIPPTDDFARQAAEVSLASVGTAPTAIVNLPAGTGRGELIEVLVPIIRTIASRRNSHAYTSLSHRATQRESSIAFNLTMTYGKDLKQVAYIPSLAVIGRIRCLEELIGKEVFGQHEKARELVNKQILNDQLLGPYLSGKQNPIPKSGSEQAGHLLFAEMAKRSEGKDRERWIELCRAAADQIFDKDGKPKDLMPYHNEMSDAVFMATPILCATGKLTGERKYHDAAVTHFRNMKKLCLREDGIYRHSPLDEAAWGRGNGFPALGLGWALSEFPEDHPAFPELKADFQNHIRALLKHQDEFGCWHQVIDKPGSYREFSATCMIGWALKRGIDRGWLDKEHHQPALDRAWLAAKQRIHDKGVVVDICTGTGKQKSLRDYYDRPAIWGVDARGGAMALMFATEMFEK